MSFDIALSGIQSINEQLVTTSNNIANAGTYGFKSSRANFSSMYSGGHASGTEIGSRTQSINQGGGVLNTGRTLDAAIDGRGFFIGKDARGALTYTRVGIFATDKEGYMVDASGRKVQGYSTQFDPAGRPIADAPLSPLGNIQVPARQLAVEATKNLSFASNMSADWTIKTVPFDQTDASTYNSSKVSAVFDSLGNHHTLNQYFVKTGDNAISIHYTLDGTDVTAPATTDLVYSNDGQLKSVAGVEAGLAPTPTPADWSPSFTPITLTQAVTGGAADLAFDIDYTGSTQYTGEAITTTNTSDGHAPGTLTGLALESDGSVTAQYSNGVSQNIGSVALATFADENALIATSDTSWQASAASGVALDYRPGGGKAGGLSVGKLELSNVDITSELVSMMTSQHNYQANSKVISTESEMLRSLLQAL